MAVYKFILKVVYAMIAMLLVKYIHINHKAQYPPRKRNERVILRRNGVILNKIGLYYVQQRVMYFVIIYLCLLELGMNELVM